LALVAKPSALSGIKSGETSWYSEDGTLWVKLVVDNAAGANVQIGTPGAAFDAGARLDVSRQVQVGSTPLNEPEPRRE